MSDSIRIIKSDQPLDEDALNGYEGEGCRLISVNSVLTHEYPPWMGIGHAVKMEVVRWTYHFRVSERWPDGSVRSSQ